MPNIFKDTEQGREQRKKWNEYNNAYSKRNYRTFTVKFRIREDAEIIDFLESYKGGATKAIRELIKKEKLNAGK